MEIRRINLFAGPSSGKSSRAAWLFYEMKKRQYSVELVTEYVKGWAYEKKEVTGFDQIYLFAKQMRREELALRNGVQYIISDSPIKLSALYAKKYSPEFFDHLNGLANVFEEQYPSLNVFVRRGDKPYSQEGRYQTFEESKELDDFILSEMKFSFNKIGVDYNINFADETKWLELLAGLPNREK